MKRLLTLIVLLGLTAGVLAGCSNSDSSSGGGTNAAPAAPSTNAPATK